MQVHSLTPQQTKNLYYLGYIMPVDDRIGNYIRVETLLVLPEEIKLNLVLTPSFPLNTKEDDENNSIIILPTLMAYDDRKFQVEYIDENDDIKTLNVSIPDLFQSVYLICNRMNFILNLGDDIVSGVTISKLVSFTVIEVKTITKIDELIINEVMKLYNSINPKIQIEHPLSFERKWMFNQFLSKQLPIY